LPDLNDTKREKIQLRELNLVWSVCQYSNSRKSA